MFMFMYAIFLPCYTLIALRRKQDLHVPPRQETRPYLRRVIERRIQAEAIPKKTRESRPPHSDVTFFYTMPNIYLSQTIQTITIHTTSSSFCCSILFAPVFSFSPFVGSSRYCCCTPLSKCDRG